ncbi:hypothetical protein FN846DRAFT_962224 [Sphaerosporella brunnea]|uniref:BTB domain-containing protein n=1 Tax=Sphaerosporella brunnea TaxID=1250544 RepID=A0A5J5EPC4_9PEZI|nr:hypothetical protein FN846DRAFT_962224 [Sphaerosporella brunnea]
MPPHPIHSPIHCNPAIIACYQPTRSRSFSHLHFRPLPVIENRWLHKVNHSPRSQFSRIAAVMSEQNNVRFGRVYRSTEPKSNSATASVAATSIDDLLASCLRIVRDGDLLLAVSVDATSKPKHYLVYSQVLCATSAVFSNMLGRNSKFAEAVALRDARKRGDDKPVVAKLEGDDTEMMKIILYALHAQYHNADRALKIEELVKAAIICDKYSLHNALRLIAKTWTTNLRSTTTTNPEDWLLISWVFGPGDIFTQVSKVLILSGSPSQGTEDQLVFGDAKRTLADCVPATVSSKLIERREKYVKDIRSHIEGLECSYLSEDWQTKTTCTVGHNGKECDTLQLGHLYRSLLVSGACTYTNSLNRITADLKKIPVLQLPTTNTHSSSRSNGYCSCGAYVQNYQWSNHNCSYNTPSNRHDNCSWVPKLHNLVDGFSDIKGLSFSDFPLRKWG